MYKLLINNNEFAGVSLRNATLSRRYDEDSIRLRDFLDNNINIYGDAYTYCFNQFNGGATELDCTLLWNTTELFTGKLMLMGDWAEAQNRASLQVEVNDRYTELLNVLDVEVRIPATFGLTQQYEAEMFTRVVDTTMRYKGLGEATASNLKPGNWAHCTPDYSIGDIPIWSSTNAYLAAREYTETGQRGYLGDVVTSPLILSNAGSYVKDGTGQIYVAKKDSTGINPIIYTDYWEPVGVVRRFGQMSSNLKFDGGIYDYGRWGLEGCIAEPQTLTLQGYRLYDLLSYYIGQADSSITIDFSTFLTIAGVEVKDLAIYFAEEPYNMSIADMISIYMLQFNVDWRLNGQVFEFKNPSELNLAATLPYPDMPYNHIDKIFSRDWSQEMFSTDAAKKVHRENFKIGNLESGTLYSGRIIEYDNSFTDEVEISNNVYEIDLAQYLKEPSGAVVFPVDDINDILDWDELGPEKVIENYYIWGRPFAKGTMIRPGILNPILLDLIKERYNKADIKVPYNVQFINFDYQIVTSFGDLDPKECSIDLGAASALITAVK